MEIKCGLLRKRQASIALKTPRLWEDYMKKELILVFIISALALCSCAEDIGEQTLISPNTQIAPSTSITTTAVNITAATTQAPVPESTSLSSAETPTASETTTGVKGSSYLNAIDIKQENGVIFSEDGKYTFSVDFYPAEVHVGDEFTIAFNVSPIDGEELSWIGYLAKIEGDFDLVTCTDTIDSWSYGQDGVGFTRHYKAEHSGTWNMKFSYDFSTDNESTYYRSDNDITTTFEILE